MKNTFILLLIFQAFSLAYSQDVITTGEKHLVESEILGETRTIQIGLPANYDAMRRYPTLYVLDAEWQFDIAYAIMKELAINDKIPDHIVIGIPKIDIEHRFKDMTFTATAHNSAGKPDSVAAHYFDESNTGGGWEFYKYLTQEVVPFVEAKFLTNGFDVLVGHSLSGYYGAYILTKEGPFNAFQLYDPSIWYNQGDAIQHFSKTHTPGLATNVFIATADGGKDRQQYNVDTHKQFHELLLEKGINSELRVYSDEGHGSVRLPGLIDGLSHLYQGFSIGYISPTDIVTVADAHKHYQDFSEKVNYEFACPLEAYRWIGHANHAQGKWEEAIKAFRLCASIFDTDRYYLSEYADCCFETGELQLSLGMYEKVLTIAPSDAATKSKIEEIEALLEKEGRE